MSKWRDIGSVVVIFLAIALALVLPSLSSAGSIEPSDPPAPTMKTLDQIPPTWDQTLQCDTTACPRFVLVMGGAGVLDKNTGLVWQQSPNSTDTDDWIGAQNRCNRAKTGGLLGWRLPTIQELASLIDPTVIAPGPKLPSGHPFANIQSDIYWSATTSAFNTSTAWFVWTNLGGGSSVGGGEAKTNLHYVWCVRGGSGVDPQ